MLRVQPAKQHFLDKLHLEREEEKHSEEERRQKEQENKQTQESSAVAQSKTPLIFTRPDGEACCSLTSMLSSSAHKLHLQERHIL